MWYDDLIETVPKWLETLKSPNGLYKHCKSAYHEESLDATTLAWDLMRMMNIYYSEAEACAMLDFIQSCQQLYVTGFYQEPHRDGLDLSIDRIWEMCGTYFGYQVAALFYNLHLVPVRPFEFYNQFLRPGAISCYMSESMPWGTKPMGAGNMVDATATMMRMNVAMGHYQYWHVIREMYDWLEERLNTRHGFWGDQEAQGPDGVVQAGYHVMRGLHLQDMREYHEPYQKLRTVVNCLHEPSASLDACHYMDCAVLLEHLLKSSGYDPRAKAAAQRIVDDIAVMRREDGAFSFEAGRAITNHNRYEISPGNVESDLVGTVFYLQALKSALRVSGKEVPWGESATHGVRR